MKTGIYQIFTKPLIKLLCIICTSLFLLLSTTSAHTQEYWNYKVQKGDTLWKLSKVHLDKISHWKKIQSLNGIADPNNLHPGSIIQFPVKLLKPNISVGRIITLSGDIEVQQSLTQKTEKAYKEMLLWTNDIIVTGGKSSATIQFSDGSKLLVQENSVIAMKELKSSGGSTFSDTKVELQSGRIHNKINPEKQHGSRFEISTPSAVAAVRGTEYRVSAEQDGESKTEVIRGEVGIASSGISQNLPGGFGTVTYTDKEPIAPVALLRPPILDEELSVVTRVPFPVYIKPVEGALAYRMQISKDKEFDSLIFDSKFPDTKLWGPDLPDSTYYLRVHGIDKNGLEGLDNVIVFSMQAHPIPPMQIKPAPDAVINNETTTFEWSEPKEARTYIFQLSNQPDFDTLLVEKNAIARTSFSLKDELSPGVYHWRVASVDDNLKRGPYNQQQFRVTPPSPDLAGAELDSDERIFRWPDSPVAQTYRCQIASDPEFTAIVVDEVVSDPQYNLKEFQPGSLFVRISAVDADGYEGPFSAYQKIKIPEPPTPPWAYALTVLILLGIFL